MEAIFAALVAFVALPVFWAVFVAIVLSLWGFVVYERGAWASAATVAVVVLAVAKFEALVTFFSNPFYILGAIIAYGLIGTLWARFKWGLFLTNKFEAIINARTDWLERNKLTLAYLQNPPPISTEGQGAVQEYTGHLRNYIRTVVNELHRTPFQIDAVSEFNSYAEFNQAVTPRALDNKATIVMWIGYWPLSAVWFIIRDLAVELGNAIYRKIGGYFQRVSDEKFAQL